MPGVCMSAVTSVAGFFKKHVLGQSLIRRNPFYYDRALRGPRRNRERSMSSAGAPG